MTINEVKADLEEIKYYYSRQKDIDVACQTVGKSIILDKVAKYNDAMKNATVQLFDIYIGLYVQGSTQENLAYDMGFSLDYIRYKKNEMFEYLISVLSA